MADAAAPTVVHGVVKSVMSGDCVVIRGKPRNGPPPERVLALAGITAPRPARRPQNTGDKEAIDEPWAWESREYLRKKLVGKAVTFTVDYAVPSGREYGTITIDAGTARAENVTHSIVRDGFAKVRENAREGEHETLRALQAAAEAAGKGLWGPNPEKHVRNITWSLSDMRALVDSFGGKPVNAIIEHVRDGCTVRAFLLPSFHYVTVMLSGIKTPTQKRGPDDKLIPDALAQQAQFYTESRLLQREVQIILEGAERNNFLGTVLHPKAGNISEYLLADGFAKVVDWSLGIVSQGREKYRAAEAQAKARRLRVWKDYVPNPAADIPDGERNYTAVVEEIVNAETIVVRVGNDSRRLNLASVRQPRAPAKEAAAPAEGAEAAPKRRGGNRMWDTPNAFEAREFLRKKLIGKKVQVTVDYVKPANEGYAAKTCATIKIGDVNIAEALISKGLATCLRHGQNDDSRASQYDDLMAAEIRAKKSGKGVHADKPTALTRISEVRSKELGDRFFPSLQRAGRVTGIVEHVMNGARYRVFIPKETAVVTVALAGLSCPRPGRQDQPDEPGCHEAIAYVRRRILQHEVELRIESSDKSGCMIGHVYIGNENIAEALVGAGLSKLHFTADRYANYNTMASLEESAMKQRLGVWADYKEPTAEELAAKAASANPDTVKDRKTKFANVVVSHVDSPTQVWAQPAESQDALAELMDAMAKAFEASPPVLGALAIKKKDVVACKFSDGSFYRASVTRIAGDEVEVKYIDYGNSETTTKSNIAALPAGLPALDPQASPFGIALIAPPPADYADEAAQLLSDLCLNKTVQCNVEYQDDGVNFATFLSEDGEADLGKEMVYNGYAAVARRREPAFRPIIKDYTSALEDAKVSHVGIWMYGDCIGDEAKEFGMGNAKPKAEAAKAAEPAK